MEDLKLNDTGIASQFASLVLHSFTAQSKLVTAFFNKHEEEVYFNEVSPGRNRAIYLLGHLVAVSDAMLPLLNLGDRQYPELESLFLTSPDKSSENLPSFSLLQQYWANLDALLATHFSRMQPAEWLERHTRVSAEDFALNKSRNKLNVLLSRTNHLAYHLGQLAFLTQKHPAH